MDHFSPLAALVGGALIGVSAALLWRLSGRIAGVSGVFGGIVPTNADDTLWRVLFLAGLPAGAALGFWLFGDRLPLPSFDTPLAVLVPAGLLVGIGTRLGGGCTSGHGVCGLARLSPRSLAAVITFMATGAATVFVVRHWL
ncbi:MAG: YeeE/YedE family protein [Bauldia sp.]